MNVVSTLKAGLTSAQTIACGAAVAGGGTTMVQQQLVGTGTVNRASATATCTIEAPYG